MKTEEGEQAEEGQAVEVESSEGEQTNIDPPFEVLRNRTHDKIKKGLSSIGKTANGCGYSYTSLNCDKMTLKDIYDILPQYQHLRVISLRENSIKNVDTLTKIQFLTHIDLSNNNIGSLDCFANSTSLKFLEHLNLQRNLLKELTPIGIPNLKILNLNFNQINNCTNFRGHRKLEVLELRKNQLTNCKGIQDMNFLHTIYLQDNQLNSISDLKNLPCLKVLMLRKNDKFESFNDVSTLPDLPALNYLNLRETKLVNFAELEKLDRYSKTLTQINCLTTPLYDEMGEAVRKNIIMVYPTMKRINKVPVEQEEVEEALKELKERKEEEERKRIEEEQKRLEAEAEAAELAKQSKQGEEEN